MQWIRLGVEPIWVVVLYGPSTPSLIGGAGKPRGRWGGSTVVADSGLPRRAIALLAMTNHFGFFRHCEHSEAIQGGRWGVGVESPRWPILDCHVGLSPSSQ